METSSASTLRKVCPQCSTTVHVRRAVCGCGYAFPSKRRARPDSVSQAMKHQRVHKANVRASETPEQTGNRQEQNRLHQARKRALETPEEVLQRKKADKEHRPCKRVCL